MKKTLSIYFLFLVTSCLCKGQTNSVEGCYIWTSNYNIGDFQKICFYSDSTFYYQRHQNDNIPDTYSRGIWKSNSDTINIKSYEPFIADSQVVQSGDPFKDSIFIKFVDIHTGESLQYRTLDIYDSNMNIISSLLTDSLGVLNMVLKKEYNYLRCRQFMYYNPILLELNLLRNEHIIIKMKIDTDALIYKDITGFNFFKKAKNILVEEYKPNEFINYYRQE